MVMAVLLATIVLATPFPLDLEQSPGCEDVDEDTPCCPLEDFEIISRGPEGWLACTETTPPLNVR